MNLSGLVAPVIGVINPPQTIELQVSVGSRTNADYSRSPRYATPGTITASIGGEFTASIPDPLNPTTLVVSAVLSGTLQVGDVVSGDDGVNELPEGATILSQISGTPGEVGSYELSASAALNACTVTSESVILNVTQVFNGVVQVGQGLNDQGALIPGTTVTGKLNGIGGPGTYTVDGPQTVAPETMTTNVLLTAQIQPLTYPDLAHLQGLNLSGEMKAVYVNGPLDGVVRPRLKGGDVIVMVDVAVWLVVQIIEAWNQTANWTKAAIRLQNDVVLAAPVPTGSTQSDAQPLGAP